MYYRNIPNINPPQAGCRLHCTRLVLWCILEFAQHHMDIALPADRDVVDQAAHIHIGDRLQLHKPLHLPAVIAGDFLGVAAKLGGLGELFQIQIDGPQFFRDPGELLLQFLYGDQVVGIQFLIAAPFVQEPLLF